MNNPSSTISASQARNNFYSILKTVSKKLKRVTVTLRGEAQAVLMHPDEVESWDETMEILADNKLLSQILKSETERKSNKTISEKKLLKELGLSQKDLE